MKCDGCKNKQLNYGLGFCRKCSATTPSNSCHLCDACSTQLSQCEVCGTGIGSQASGSSYASPGGNTYKVTLRAKDNGKTIGSVRVGEQVEIELDEDQYSGKEYGVKQKDSQFGLAGNTFTQNAQNPRYGARSLLFDCLRPGTGEIELHEVQRNWYSGWGGGGGHTPVPNGKTFKVTVDVR